MDDIDLQKATRKGLSSSSSKVQKDPEIPSDLLIVDQDVARELQCGVCLQLVDEHPRQCLNGHLFCHPCILQCLERKLECPVCRTFLTESTLVRSICVEKIRAGLKSYCKYKFRQVHVGAALQWVLDEAGCQETVPLESRQQHEENCVYGTTTCKFSPDYCGPIRKKDLAAHYLECPFRLVSCELCGREVQFSALDSHLGKCPMFRIPCRRCKTEVPRQDMTLHLRNDCPEEVVPCIFADAGCTFEAVRKEHTRHLEESMPDHILLLGRKVDHQNQRIKEQEELIRSLQEQLHLASLETASLEFSIPNWSSAKWKGFIRSKELEFAGFTWFLALHPNGHTSADRDFLSIFLHVDDGAKNYKTKQVRVDFTFRIVNHVDPSATYRCSFKSIKFGADGNSSWGHPRAFLRSKATEAGGFIKNNTLSIKVEMRLRKTKWKL